jgi:hypothetical protein
VKQIRQCVVEVISFMNCGHKFMEGFANLISFSILTLCRQKRYSERLGSKLDTAGNVLNAASVLLLSQVRYRLSSYLKEVAPKYLRL